jgi:hypothetical protein
LPDFVEKSQDSVVDFNCCLDGGHDQNMIIPVNNKCDNLQHLEINRSCFSEWDWSKHSISPTVKELTFGGSSDND